jgi:hypothetical protein
MKTTIKYKNGEVEVIEGVYPIFYPEGEIIDFFDKEENLVGEQALIEDVKEVIFVND